MPGDFARIAKQEDRSSATGHRTPPAQGSRCVFFVLLRNRRASLRLGRSSIARSEVPRRSGGSSPSDADGIQSLGRRLPRRVAACHSLGNCFCMQRKIALPTLLFAFVAACSGSSTSGEGTSDSIATEPGTDSVAADTVAEASADTSASSDGPVDAILPGDATGEGGPDVVSSTYPSGPYGSAEGKVIPNLAWKGYIDPSADVVATTEPYASYSMDDARRSGRKYLLLHVSDFI